MKVYIVPADLYGCGHYRLIWPAQALHRQRVTHGHDVVVIAPRQRGQFINASVFGKELVDVNLPADADVVVFQRVTHRLVADAITKLRARGVAVVIDMDDDLRSVHPSNPAYPMMHPSHANAGFSEHSWHHTQRACEGATLVTASTDALLRRYAPHGRGVVLRNCVPSWYLDVERRDSDVIGWAGSLHSHPDDLQAVGTALARLQRDGARFRVVGPPVGVREALRLDQEPEWTGELDLAAQWPYCVAALGVGVAPLADTVFNQAKSWLKPLEYAALGVPWVASPRTEYRRLHKLGCGILAEKPNAWYRVLDELRRSPERRRELAEAGRAAVRGLTIEDNAWRWLEAWEDALKLQRRDVSSPFART